MGRVWRAYDRTLDREVALKEVLVPFGMSERAKADMTTRMLREARLGARLRHPAIVRVHDVLTADDHPWIVMELIDGRSLEDLILSTGALAPERVAAIGLSLLGALRAAHRAGVIHRDVKPANVLVEDDDSVALTDFGIAYEMDQASMTATGTMIGSPQYMAPERVRGDAPGPASDLFSLGGTLYAAVEGRAPFERTGQLATLAAVLNDPPDAFDKAGPLRPILAGLLDKDPASRPSAEEVEDALRSVVEIAAAPTTGDLSGPPPAAPPVGEPPVETRPAEAPPVSEPPVAEPAVAESPAVPPDSVAVDTVSAPIAAAVPDVPPPLPSVTPKRGRRRILLLVAAAVAVVLVAVGGTFAYLQLSRKPFYNGIAAGRPLTKPSEGFVKVQTPDGTVELGEIATFGRAVAQIPVGWKLVGESRDDRWGPGLSPPDSLDVVLKLRAEEGPHLAVPIERLRIERKYAQANLAGYHEVVFKAVNEFSGDSAPAAQWSYTWDDNGVRRRVMALVRQRDQDLYIFSMANPASDDYGWFFIEILGHTTFG